MTVAHAVNVFFIRPCMILTLNLVGRKKIISFAFLTHSPVCIVTFRSVYTDRPECSIMK